MFRDLIIKAQQIKPYISGHVTDESSTFTFTVNENESVTVNVNSEGWWKWYVDRTIASLNSAFKGNTNIDELYLYKIDLSIDCRFFFANNGTSTFHIIDISKCLPITNGIFTWFTAASKCILYLPKIEYGIVSILSSMSQIFATKGIYAHIDISTSNGLIKENVLSIIKYMMGNYTIKLSSTIYNKCALGGEWYDDIQAAIDAKAQQGYTVTLISA